MSRATPDLPCRKESYGYGAVTRIANVFHRLFSFYLPCVMGVLYPDMAVTISVWARPSSIASTRGFTVVFSSSGYLDVSVHRVRSLLRCRTFSTAGRPIQTSSDLSLFAAPQGFSQLTASFVAS